MAALSAASLSSPSGQNAVNSLFPGLSLDIPNLDTSPAIYRLATDETPEWEDRQQAVKGSLAGLAKQECCFRASVPTHYVEVQAGSRDDAKT